MITLTIPNDDTVALRQFGKALIEIASEKDGHPVDVTVTPLVIGTETLQQSATVTTGGIIRVKEPEIDTTEQQYEALQEHVKTKHIKLVTAPFIDTDSTGTPWDERIHSTSKALNSDGTWRLRRKPKEMDEVEWAALVESVKNELSHAMESFDEQVIMEEDSLQRPLYGIDRAHEKGDETAELTIEPPVTPPGDDFRTDADVVTEKTVAGIPPLPVPPPVPEVTIWDFPRLMTFLTERHGKIDVATVNTLLAQDGMSSVQELNAHPDKIGPFVARVKAHLGE